MGEAAAAVKPGAARFVCVQTEYSLFHREPEDGVLAECARKRIAFLPYFPLASGMLTGKFRRGLPRRQGRASAADWALSAADLEEIDRMLAGRRVKTSIR